MITQNAQAFGAAIDGANMARVEMLRDVEESRATRAHAPSETVCEGITGMSGLGPGRVQQETVSAERSASMVGRLTQDPTVITIAAEAGDTRARYERLVQLYCDPARRCPVARIVRGRGSCMVRISILGHCWVKRRSATGWRVTPQRTGPKHRSAGGVGPSAVSGSGDGAGTQADSEGAGVRCPGSARRRVHQPPVCNAGARGEPRGVGARSAARRHGAGGGGGKPLRTPGGAHAPLRESGLLPPAPGAGGKQICCGSWCSSGPLT